MYNLYYPYKQGKLDTAKPGLVIVIKLNKGLT